MKKQFSIIFTSFILCLFHFSAHAFQVSGDKWGNSVLGTPGGTLTYGFSTSAFCPPSSCNPADVVGAGTFMPVGFENEFANAFAAWSSVANIDFVMAADPETADIKIAGDNTLMGNALAYAWFPTIGDIFFNAGVAWSLDDTGTSSSIFLVALHEIGHSLGLDHSVFGTIMNGTINAALTGLTADDIAGAQAIYGVASVTAVPLPAAFWMLFVGLVSLAPFPRKKIITA